MCRVGQLCVRDASRIHARAADTNLAAASPDASQHHLGVVVALRDFLILLRAARGIPHEEHFHFFAVALGQGTGEPKRVVAAFGAVWWVIQNEERFRNGSLRSSYVDSQLLRNTGS